MPSLFCALKCLPAYFVKRCVVMAALTE
jgi:hypothetical protein